MMCASDVRILLSEDVPLHKPLLHSQISRRDLVHKSGKCRLLRFSERASKERLLHRS